MWNKNTICAYLQLGKGSCLIADVGALYIIGYPLCSGL